jgi:hypothetical protein
VIKRAFVLLGCVLLIASCTSGSQEGKGTQDGYLGNLPAGLVVAESYEWSGETGMIGGGPVTIAALIGEAPDDDRVDLAALACEGRALSSPGQNDPPGYWERCTWSDEDTGEWVQVGTLSAFRRYNAYLADKVCDVDCADDTVIVWVQET